MRRAERVVFAFGPLGEAGQAAALAQGADALAAAGEAADRAAKEGDATRTLAARVLAGSCLTRLGKMNEAEGVLRSAIESAGPNVALGTKAQALRELSFVATKRGAFALGEARARESLELARRARDPMAQHAAVSALAAATQPRRSPSTSRRSSSPGLSRSGAARASTSPTPARPT